MRVIVEGKILLKSHSANILLPQTRATLFAGDFVGFRSDNGESRKDEAYLISSDKGKTTLIVYEQDYFEFMWAAQQHNNNYHITQMLLKHPVFESVSEQTIYLLGYELLKLIEYEKGITIMKQAKRSPLNEFYNEFYSNRLEKIAIKRKLKKEQGMDAVSRLKERMLDKFNKYRFKKEDKQAITAYQDSTINLAAFKKTEILKGDTLVFKENTGNIFDRAKKNAAGEEA